MDASGTEGRDARDRVWVALCRPPLLNSVGLLGPLLFSLIMASKLLSNSAASPAVSLLVISSVCPHLPLAGWFPTCQLTQS